MNEYIKSDLYRCYGKTGFRTFIRGMLEDPGFNYMFWLRMCQAGGTRKMFALPIHKWKRTFGKINIGYKCKPIQLRGETKICPVCKAEVDGDALFCNHCGAQL